jgi:predicted DNA-binding transcriptional regulator AlpA
VTQTLMPRRDSILLLSDAERLLGLTRPTLQVYVRDGRLPRPRRLGQRGYWLSSELHDALALAPQAPAWPGVEAGPESVSAREEAGAA